MIFCSLYVSFHPRNWSAFYKKFSVFGKFLVRRTDRYNTVVFFLPRDVMHSAVFLLSCGVRLSVRLSVTLVYCVETATKLTIKLFHRHSGSIILVFPTGHLTVKFWWCLPNRYQKIAIFNQYLIMSEKRYEIRPWLLWIDNRKSF